MNTTAFHKSNVVQSLQTLKEREMQLGNALTLVEELEEESELLKELRIVQATMEAIELEHGTGLV